MQEDYVPYWPTEEGENMTYGPFDVSTKQVDKQPDHVKTVLHLSDTVSWVIYSFLSSVNLIDIRIDGSSSSSSD